MAPTPCRIAYGRAISALAAVTSPSIINRSLLLTQLSLQSPTLGREWVAGGWRCQPGVCPRVALRRRKLLGSRQDEPSPEPQPRPGATRVVFDDKQQHRYKKESHHKLMDAEEKEEKQRTLERLLPLMPDAERAKCGPFLSIALSPIQRLPQICVNQHRKQAESS